MTGIWTQIRSQWFLSTLLVCCVGIELTLLASDYGLLSQGRLRVLAYEYCGFWKGLLGTWRPNYAAQPYAMFGTYAFLHAGPVHLIVNMITLWSLGRIVRDRVGTGGLMLLYAGSALGGAGGFALLGTNLAPMVGASGALFGLVGGLLAWNYVDRYTFTEGLWPVAQAAALLIALNLVMWWAMDGQMAWQTHLGGFIAGWILALLIDPRGRAAV
ncbi:MAG: rhomboid family intramembrane serine protease [Pseudomonadota bacterium]